MGVQCQVGGSPQYIVDWKLGKGGFGQVYVGKRAQPSQAKEGINANQVSVTALEGVKLVEDVKKGRTREREKEGRGLLRQGEREREREGGREDRESESGGWGEGARGRGGERQRE